MGIQENAENYGNKKSSFISICSNKDGDAIKVGNYYTTIFFGGDYYVQNAGFSSWEQLGF